MSSHYLISLFDDSITDVLVPIGAPPTSLITGSYVITVPDDVAVKKPVSLSNLLAQKYQGILGSRGIYSTIIYDPMLDATNVNMASSHGVCTGFKGSICLYPTDPSNPHPALVTTAHGITWLGAGVGPTQAMVTYELFTYVDSDPATGAYQRQFQELPTDHDVALEVSFNGGTTFIPTIDKALVTIPPAARGTQLILRFTRTTDVTVTPRIFIGSWAVLY